MTIHKILLTMVSSLAAISMTACGGGGAGSTTNDSAATGTVKVLLTDAPGDYESVFVTVDKILVHKAGNDDVNSTDNNESNVTNTSGWISIAQPQKTYDLLDLTNGVTTDLGEANISTGKYTQVRLVLGNLDDNTTNNPHPYSHYVVFTAGGDPQELTVPSNTIKTNRNLDILAGQTTTMILDFDANKSIVEAGTDLKLKPVISIEVVPYEVNATLDSNTSV